jgi:hypothetical protein
MAAERGGTLLNFVGITMNRREFLRLASVAPILRSAQEFPEITIFAEPRYGRRIASAVGPHAQLRVLFERYHDCFCPEWRTCQSKWGRQRMLEFRVGRGRMLRFAELPTCDSIEALEYAIVCMRLEGCLIIEDPSYVELRRAYAEVISM